MPLPVHVPGWIETRLDANIAAMDLHDTPTSFEAALADQGSTREELDAETLLATMAEWYRSERCVDAASLESDGDMLLVQWGRWKFLVDEDEGADPPFVFDLTRQLIGPAAEDEDIWQLSVRLIYEPTDATDAAGQGNHWCFDPSGLDDFTTWVAGTTAYRVVRTERPARVAISWGIAG